MAATFGSSYLLSQANGNFCSYEKLNSGVFGESLQRGGQRLRLNHGAPIPGRFLRLGDDARALRFEFEVRASSLGHQVMGEVQSGAISKCSLGFNTLASRYEGQVRVISAADLQEISVLKGTQAAYWDTFVRVAT